MRKFKFLNNEYPLVINWFQAVDEFPGLFDLHIADLVSDGVKSQDTVNTIMLNDNTIIKLMWHYLKPHVEFEFVDFLKKLPNEDFHAFRNTFWETVLDFSGPLKVNLLKQIWTEQKKELQELTLEKLDSRSSQEESTQTP